MEGWEVAQVACSLHAVPVPRGLGVHSLVGGMAVTDHLSQDPLLVPIHGLHPGSHFISRFGHIVPRGWNGPAEWGGPEGGVKCQSQPRPCQLPLPGPALTCRQASRSTGAGSWLTAAAESSAPPSAWSSEEVPSHCTGLQSLPLREGCEPLRHQGQGVCPWPPSMPVLSYQEELSSTSQFSTKGPYVIPVPSTRHLWKKK